MSVDKAELYRLIEKLDDAQMEQVYLTILSLCEGKTLEPEDEEERSILEEIMNSDPNEPSFSLEDTLEYFRSLRLLEKENR